MIPKRYKSFHITTLLLVAAVVLSWWGFVMTEDRAKASQEPIIQPTQAAVSSLLSYQPVEEYVEQDSATQYDFVSDDSLQKYLGNGQTLNDPNYIPADLSPIDSNFTANNARKFMLRQEAGVAFADLAWHFWKAWNGDRLTITSAYRSGTFQESLLKKWCSRARCAQVGSSEHQLWLALDLGVVTKGGKYIALNQGNAYYTWLSDNAAAWWFHNSYQKGIEVDGQMEEGRHRRYVGKDLAALLSTDNQTFGEWYSVTVQNKNLTTTSENNQKTR